MQQMIVANRLTDGLVVFLTADGAWTLDIAEGVVIDDEAEQGKRLERAKADEAGCIVIDPYLIEVTREGGTPRPTSIREAIRAFGPTVSPGIGPT